MSHVYLARHADLKRLAAVKVLKPHVATDEAVARFQREAQLCSQLSHPNTVEIYDYGTTREGRWYYAMEYLRGISLEDLVARCQWRGWCMRYGRRAARSRRPTTAAGCTAT
jgi:serine/threonine protein kinase